MLWFLACIMEKEHQSMEVERPEPYVAEKQFRVKARHILIAHSDALLSDKTLKRTKQDAIGIAESVLEKFETGAKFETLAIKYSDDPNRNEGGVLPAFGKDEMDIAFETTVFTMKIYEVAVVSGSFGVHVVQRLPLEECRLRSLVVQYENARESTQSRSKEEALELIQSLRQQAENGVDMEQIVHNYSDGPFGKWGGYLGYVEKDHMSELFQETLIEMKEGSISPILESSYGFHLFQKLPYLEEEISETTP